MSVNVKAMRAAPPVISSTWIGPTNAGVPSSRGRTISSAIRRGSAPPARWTSVDPGRKPYHSEEASLSGWGTRRTWRPPLP